MENNFETVDILSMGFSKYLLPSGTKILLTRTTKNTKERKKKHNWQKKKKNCEDLNKSTKLLNK